MEVGLGERRREVVARAEEEALGELGDVRARAAVPRRPLVVLGARLAVLVGDAPADDALLGRRQVVLLLRVVLRAVVLAVLVAQLERRGERGGGALHRREARRERVPNVGEVALDGQCVRVVADLWPADRQERVAFAARVSKRRA